jgi:hypothetical protein
MKYRNKNIQIQIFIVFQILTIIGLAYFFVFSSFYQASWLYNWNGIRKFIKDSIKIYEYTPISSSVGSYNIAIKEEVKTRKWIIEKATVKELERLTEYPNGNVKAIAYEGLIRREKYNHKKELILKAIKDTFYPVYYHTGCCENLCFNISEYIIHYIMIIDPKIPKPSNENEFVKDIGLTELDKNEILIEFYNSPKRAH